MSTSPQSSSPQSSSPQSSSLQSSSPPLPEIKKIDINSINGYKGQEYKIPFYNRYDLLEPESYRKVMKEMVTNPKGDRVERFRDLMEKIGDFIARRKGYLYQIKRQKEREATGADIDESIKMLKEKMDKMIGDIQKVNKQLNDNDKKYLLLQYLRFREKVRLLHEQMDVESVNRQKKDPMLPIFYQPLLKIFNITYDNFIITNDSVRNKIHFLSGFENINDIKNYNTNDKKFIQIEFNNVSLPLEYQRMRNFVIRSNVNPYYKFVPVSFLFSKNGNEICITKRKNKYWVYEGVNDRPRLLKYEERNDLSQFGLLGAILYHIQPTLWKGKESP